VTYSCDDDGGRRRLGIRLLFEGVLVRLGYTNWYWYHRDTTEYLKGSNAL